MGKSPTELLRWVVDFAYTDLDVLRPEERQAKSYDLRVLPWLVKMPIKRTTKGGVTQAWPGYEVGPMPEAVLRAVQSKVLKGLRGLFEGKSWELPKRKAFIWKMSPNGAPKTRFGILWELGEQEEEGIVGAVADLVLTAGECLRSCSECRKLFVANRKQRYCSPAHSQKARNFRKKTGPA